MQKVYRKQNLKSVLRASKDITILYSHCVLCNSKKMDIYKNNNEHFLIF